MFDRLHTVLNRLSGRARDPYRRALAAFARGRSGEAVALLRPAAEAGLAEAQMRLGQALESGEGVLVNPVDALAWYQKAAEQGHEGAQARLARLYCLGCAPPPVELANPAVRQLFPNGLAVERDLGLAQKWARAAAERGLVEAQALLGDLLAGVHGGSPDYPESRRWYEAAAQQGHAGAQCGLAILLAGAYLGAPDPAAALPHFEAAAHQGDVRAHFYLAIMFSQGLGVAIDDARAVEHFARAAAGGIAGAQRMLGWFALSGRGMAQNPFTAESWRRCTAAATDCAPIWSRRRAGIGLLPNWAMSARRRRWARFI